ncbi:MAG: 4-alpha-glucanotransferase, partial [Muribaculaceae bacterium]|nr:4-alpha-glucanotransferase [Muribaculaceae bacterium]
MKLIFYIDYRTNWGESVYITGQIPELGGGDLSKAVKLDLHGSQLWTKEIEVDDKTGDFTYGYVVIHDNGYIRHEWGSGHRFSRGRGIKLHQIFDRWHDLPADKPYYSSAFTDCICRRQPRQKALVLKRGMLNIRVSAPMIGSDEVLAITGDNDILGNWEPSKAIVMNDARFPEWEVGIDMKRLSIPFQYKFLILKKKTGKVVSWENCENRHFSYMPVDISEAMTVAGLRLADPAAPWKGAGTAIPVFSLRSNEDFGSGDFYDLKLMVDWAVMTGQRFLQILPINDTTMSRTWTDSYPYNANSTFALHPMYLRPNAIGHLNDPDRQAEFDRLGRELNQLPTVDYERVNRVKNDYVRALFVQDGQTTMATTAFQDFIASNAHWLTPYAAFCVLRDRFGSADFSTWGEFAVYEPERIAAFVSTHADEINYVYFV